MKFSVFKVKTGRNIGFSGGNCWVFRYKIMDLLIRYTGRGHACFKGGRRRLRQGTFHSIWVIKHEWLRYWLLIPMFGLVLNSRTVLLRVYRQVYRARPRISNIGDRPLAPTLSRPNRQRRLWLWSGKPSKMLRSSSSKWPPSSHYFYLSFPPVKKVSSVFISYFYFHSISLYLVRGNSAREIRLCRLSA